MFLNLIVNAAHAIAAKVGPQNAEKGTITVRTSCDDRVVRIEISDTGTGVVDKHKGAVDLVSVEGRGSTFIVSLPIYEEMPIE